MELKKKLDLAEKAVKKANDNFRVARADFMAADRARAKAMHDKRQAKKELMAENDRVQIEKNKKQGAES